MKKQKCGWCIGDTLYEDYHDTEWGVPTFDDAKLFECLTLESFQSGLSWITILKKRDNFKNAFDNFNYKKIAHYNEHHINTLLSNKGIIRHKQKINATITNAKAFLIIQNEYESFSNYIWAFANHKPIKNKVTNYKSAPANTLLSATISADLKKRGFKFVGATTVYAFMQAIGMVNDHETHCFRYDEL